MLKRATQAKVDICLKMNCKDFGYKALFVSYSLLTSRSPAGDLVADVETKLSIAGCLTLVSSSLLQNSTADLYMKLHAF